MGFVSGVSCLAGADFHVVDGEKEQDISRCDAFGNFAVQHKPRYLLINGDFGDFPSLAAHNGSRAVGGQGGNRTHVNKRLLDDLNAFELAFERLNRPIETFNKNQSRAGRKAKQYHPIKVFIGGNHENRLEKIPNHIYELDGMIGECTIKEIVEKNGWLYVPFREQYEIQDIPFRHFFPSGTMGKAVPPRQGINTLLCSGVQAHGHKYFHEKRQTARHKRNWIHFLQLPSFKPQWRLNDHEDSGLVLMNNIKGSEYDPMFLSYDHIISKYGGLQ